MLSIYQAKVVSFLKEKGVYTLTSQIEDWIKDGYTNDVFASECAANILYYLGR